MAPLLNNPELARQIVLELRPNDTINSFTTNTDLIGAYAEASLRQLVIRMVDPLRVCTGAVISPELCANPRSLPQLDLIIWSPSPAPTIYCSGDFGLVPRRSALASSK